jgi:phage terminase large subunit-like protein
MASNQSGKTWCGGGETAIHLTGRYPDWWDGAVFDKPPKFWVLGVTGESTRDNPQRILVGPPPLEERWGTGAIPADALTDWDRASGGVSNLLDNVQVCWGGGGDVQQGTSICMFKAYEKGREKLQGDTIDAAWLDEEPDEEIYIEVRTRTQKGQLGFFTYMTFTPLLGATKVVLSFLDKRDVEVMA